MCRVSSTRVRDFFNSNREARAGEPRLHLHAMPPVEVARLAAAYHPVLSGWPVTIVPDDALHLTLVDIEHDGVGRLTDEQYVRLREALAEALADMPAPVMQVGPALPGDVGVTLDLVPDEQIEPVTDAAATAIRAVLGPDSYRPARSRRPHIGIAYGVADTPLQGLSALARVRSGRVTWRIEHVALVDQVQDVPGRRYRVAVRDTLACRPTGESPAVNTARHGAGTAGGVVAATGCARVLSGLFTHAVDTSIEPDAGRHPRGLRGTHERPGFPRRHPVPAVALSEVSDLVAGDLVHGESQNRWRHAHRVAPIPLAART